MGDGTIRGLMESISEKVKKEAGLKTYKIQKVPDRNSKKNLKAKERAKVLQSDLVRNYDCCIMENETYVLANFLQLPGQEFYVADARGNVTEKFRVQKRSKFLKRFWSVKPFVLVI